MKGKYQENQIAKHKSLKTFHKAERCVFNNIDEISNYIFKNDVEFVDFCFCDAKGQWHHCTYAAEAISTEALENFYFDGSSISLLSTINESDMLMVPDWTTCWIDPFQELKTIHVICDVKKSTEQIYNRCPRTIAKLAMKAVNKMFIGGTVNFGPETEFFVFDQYESNISQGEISSKIDGEEMCWKNIKHDASFYPGCRNLKKNMYFPTPPVDRLMQYRNHVLNIMKGVGINIEKHHHEVGGCQCEIGYKHDILVTTADNIMTCKYIVKNLAALYNKTATFMPKPIYGEPGSGCHLHQSIWTKDGGNIFYTIDNDKFWNLSKTALYYIGGILYHAKALCAITNPTTNSYKRLVPGYEAPCKLSYGKANRTVAIRIPESSSNEPKSKRIECRFPDSACCPYLACAALCLAGLDGIEKKIDPPAPCETNLYVDTNFEVSALPSTLRESLDALESDHEFLLRDDVFSKSWIVDYINLKRTEVADVESIPHPKEYEFYFNS